MVDEYQDIDFGEMGGESFISPSSDLINPNKVLETTGIDVSSKATSDSQDDLYTNPIIKQFVTGKSSKDISIFDNLYSEKFPSYENMLTTAGLVDKSNSPFNTRNMMSQGAASALLGPAGILFGGGDFGFGTQLKGPTGKNVFSVGGISERALQKHFANFTAVQQARQAAIQTIGQSNLPKSIDRNKDMGFAMTIGNNHFSRAPNQMYYDGLKSHLSSEDGNAHAMLKAMDAISKGFDPRGFRLDGENEDTGDALNSGGTGGSVTDDGYYTFVANNGFGYSKSKLYGGSLTKTLADDMGVSITVLTQAMEKARADKNVTVTSAIEELTASDDIAIITDVPENEDDNNNKKDTMDDRIKAGDYSLLNKGGEVKDSPTVSVNQLASILKTNRLSQNETMDDGLVENFAQKLNEGGQINLNEVGFIGGKTPNQVTEKDSIADDVPLNMKEDDYMLNSPSVEKHGIRNVVNMITRGLRDASAAGVEIVDIPVDIPRSELVKVLASESEVRIPSELVPFIGLANLETINKKGIAEVERRTK